MKPLNSIFFKILVTILVTFILPLCLLFFAGYRSMEFILQQKIQQLATINLTQMEETLQNTVNQITRSSSYISSDLRLNELVRTYSEAVSFEKKFSYSFQRPEDMDKYTFYQLSSEIQTQLFNHTNTWLPEGAQAALILNNGQIFCTWSSYNTDFELLHDILQSNQTDTYLSDAHPCFIEYYDTQQYVTLVKKIYNIQNIRHSIAQAVITIPVSALEDILTSYQNDMFSFFILDQDKNVVAQADIDSIPVNQLVEKYDSLYPGEQHRGVKLYNTYFDRFFLTGPSWSVCVSVPYDSIYQELTNLQRMVLGGGIGLIVMVTVILFLQLYRLLLPLKRLAVSMYQMEHGNWNTPALPVTSNDEIGWLTQRFNHLIKRLQQMFDQIKDAERQKGELKFEMLLAQINPHFLFNTLNSIKWMAKMAHAENIAVTIQSLGRLLDISMNRQKDVISVADEIKNLKSYLDIQSIRYSDLFTVCFDIDEQLPALECLKLVFQPIVENAIIHNIHEERALSISVSGRLKDNMVILEISDNGKGITEQQIRQMLHHDTSHEKSVFRGIGVSNVHQRLQLKYGPDYGVVIDSEPGQGTCVQIYFPAIRYTAQQEGEGDPI